MRNFWQPNIDNWIPESFGGNTEHVKDVHSFVPPPHLTDYVGTQQYAPGEGEEMKINIAGQGKMAIKEIKGKIVEMLKQILDLADSDKISDIEQLEHRLFKEPALHNIVKEYLSGIKEYKASSTGLP
jgi:hypothetical protein